MKNLTIAILGAGVLVGAILYINRPQATPMGPAEPVVEADATITSEAPAPERVAPPSASTQAPSAAPESARQQKAKPSLDSKARLDLTMVNQAVDILVSPQVGYGQKQAAWQQLGDAGKLDQAISELEQRMAADPQAPQYPAALGQAYLKKCATLQDVREQGILGMQADKLFDVALNLDPTNWEARFTKAVAFSFWPPSMNKGDQAIENFRILIQQQEEQTPQPHFAESYFWLGSQYQKAARGDYARLVWERGVSLFPNHEGLKQKLAEASAPLSANSTSAQ